MGLNGFIPKRVNKSYFLKEERYHGSCLGFACYIISTANPAQFVDMVIIYSTHTSLVEYFFQLYLGLNTVNSPSDMISDTYVMNQQIVQDQFLNFRCLL